MARADSVPDSPASVGTPDSLRDPALWRRWAVDVLTAEQARSGETSIHRFPLPVSWGVELFLKDETSHVTGSLKHRLARALFLSAVVDGRLGPGTVVVEASSGSTAVSEAYFARMLGLAFVAVVPHGTSPAKIALIERYGGTCHEAAADALSAESRRIARERSGYFMDQFGNASAVTDWLGESGIAASALSQLHHEEHPVPAWFVVGVGTGGTSAGIGRYLRRHRLDTRVAMVDPEGSAYFDAWTRGHSAVQSGSRIEGIGRPRVEQSFVASVIDAALRIPDDASIAAAVLLRETTGIWAGASTGTNLVGALALAVRMRDRGERGSIVTLVCDHGDRYASSYFDEAWLARTGIDPEPALAGLRALLRLPAAPWPLVVDVALSEARTLVPLPRSDPATPDELHRARLAG